MDTMKLYDLVKILLEKYPECRNSDRYLMWKIWDMQGIVRDNRLSKFEFIYTAIHPESIRRTRQKIQEKYSELKADEKIQEERKKIQEQKGTHIYRETTEIKQEQLFELDDISTNDIYNYDH